MLQAPKVLKRPKTIKAPNGDEREDHYYWLRDDDRENPEVLEHLKVSEWPQAQRDSHLSPVHGRGMQLGGSCLKHGCAATG